MNRDVSGVRGQFVTTWGSVVENGVVKPGSEQPLTTTLTCRCGKSASYRDFPLHSLNLKAKFVCPLPRVVGEPSEWFCSVACAAEHEPNALKEAALDLSERINDSISLLGYYESYLPSSSERDPES